ncbi:DUF5329 family protein [Motiliproteus coralliicola]|uniref:DUF5329 family protein n=1 Tax=Motiliproteus coralliicola TaxID=2283196 RepID=UPI001403BED3
MATTECSYERNGKRYSGIEAVEHISKKYDYFKDEIATAEEFIEYSATKSTLSGRSYLIHCEGKPAVKSGDWLQEALEKYRVNQ